MESGACGCFLVLLLPVALAAYSTNDGLLALSSILTRFQAGDEDSPLRSGLVQLVHQNGSHCFQEMTDILIEGGPTRNIVLDAMGKPSSGILEGNLAWIGDYQQCSDAPGLHYCILRVTMDAEISPELGVTLGVCVPDPCTESDLNLWFKAIGNVTQMKVHAEAECTVKKTPRVDTGVIGTVVFLGVLLAVVLCATFYEAWITHHVDENEEVGEEEEEEGESEGARCSIVGRRDKTYGTVERGETSPQDQVLTTPINLHPRETDLSRSSRCLLCFSLYRTMGRILSTDSSPDDILCLHGMRTISMFWIILGHTCSFLSKTKAIENIVYLYMVSVKRFSSMVLPNAYAALDSFFLMGGLLMAYTGCHYLNKTGIRVNWLGVILHRYLRLTPTVCVMILLYTFVYPSLGEGPYWGARIADAEHCRTWWWTNLLYINNFVPASTSRGCVSWTWYLATDMQLFLMSIPLVILLWRYPVIGYVCACLTTLASVILNAVIYSKRNYQGFRTATTVTENDGGFFIFSVKPYACAIPYLTGVATGYALHILRSSSQLKLYRCVVLLGWLVAFGVGMAVVYGMYGTISHPDVLYVEPSKAVNVAYGCLHSLGWSLAVAWVVVMCHHGYGGVINRFLSWRAWIPLSRLTFCAYLVHPAVIYFFTGTLTSTIGSPMTVVAVLSVGFVCLSYAAAFILSAIVEMPAFGLKQTLIKK